MNDDLISRKALKKVFGYTDEWYKGRTICAIIDNAPPIETTIENLISTLSVEELKATTWFKVDTPSGEVVSYRREKTGHWIEKTNIYGEGTYECSNCGNPWTITEGTPDDNDMNFCPNCGVYMGKEASDE